MKKLLILGLTVLLTLGMATLTLAIDIETTGDLNFQYHAHHGTGEKSRYTDFEAGLNNHFDINDLVSGDLNFWMGTNGSEHELKIDAGYVTFNFEGKTLKVGYDDYPLDASLNVLGDFVKNGLFSGGIKGAAVQLLGTVPLGDSFKLQGGYFHNTGGNYKKSNKTATSEIPKYNGVMGDDGRDNFLLRGSYTAGKFNTNLTYLYLGEWVWDTVEPAAEFMIDTGYKINDKYRVYAAYVGVNKYYDGNTLGGKESADKLDKFGIIGFSASLGRWWFSAEYTVLTPDKDENKEWIYYADGTEVIHNWADNPPYGFSISYYFGYNTTLQYTRVADTGNSNDRDRIRLQIKF